MVGRYSLSLQWLQQAGNLCKAIGISRLYHRVADLYLLPVSQSLFCISVVNDDQALFAISLQLQEHVGKPIVLYTTFGTSRVSCHVTELHLLPVSWPPC